MSCRICEESAKDKHLGAVVGLRYDEKGTAHYICLSCVISKMEDEYLN